ncbi:MAG TPA: porin [Rhizomicrobium sp.]|jgi:phosphate-selective porin OprO/OprP
MQGKLRLLAGVAGGALLLSGTAGAQAATTTTTTTVTKHHRHHHPLGTKRVAVGANSRTIAELERRIDALEAEVHRAEMGNPRTAVTARPRHHRVGNPGQTTTTEVAVAQTESPTAAAPEAAGTNAELEQRVAGLEKQLDAQRDRDEAEHTRLVTLEQNFNDTTWSFDNARPTIKSGDGRFTMAIRARFQFDDVNYMQSSDVNKITPTRSVQFKDLSSGTLVRRAFFGVEGKAFNDFWYELRYNAGGGGNAETDPKLSLARVAYLGIPNFELNAGVIEPAFMYEGTMSSGALPFLERPEIDNIAADSFGAGDSRKGVEVRFQKQGTFMPDDNLVLDAAFTGSKTESTTGHGNGGDEQTQILGHAAYRVWSDGISNISFSGDYAHAFTGGCTFTDLSSGNCVGNRTNPVTLQDRPEFREDGDRLISSGKINARNASMWAVSGGANFENFYVGGEYAHFDVDRLPVKSGGDLIFNDDNPGFNGWYVEGTWVITGEPKSYTVTATNNEVGGFGAPKVASPFSFSGDSWGAWELTGRYSDTDLNWNKNRIASGLTQAGIPGGEERILMVGLNWYLNNNVKLQVNDGITHVSKIASAGSNVQTGQNLNILGVRLQFTN